MSAYIFDTETTGIASPELISAAWLRIEDPVTLEVVEAFDQLYRPEGMISLGAMAVHHIMDEDLEACPPASTFSLPDDVEYLVGHNIDFDWQVAGRPEVRRIDTLCLCRALWPDADAHSQSAMMYLLERDSARDRLRDAHSAAADVELCRTILRHIVSRLGVESWSGLWEASESARIPTVMPFGKHKGIPISEVPKDYKQWLLRQPDVDPYLVKALEA